MNTQKPNKKRKNYHHHKPETWTSTICKRCLGKLRPIRYDSGEICNYECDRCGETYVPDEITYTEK